MLLSPPTLDVSQPEVHQSEQYKRQRVSNSNNTTTMGDTSISSLQEATAAEAALTAVAAVVDKNNNFKAAVQVAAAKASGSSISSSSSSSTKSVAAVAEALAKETAAMALAKSKAALAAAAAAALTSPRAAVGADIHGVTAAAASVPVVLLPLNSEKHHHPEVVMMDSSSNSNSSSTSSNNSSLGNGESCNCSCWSQQPPQSSQHQPVMASSGAAVENVHCAAAAAAASVAAAKKESSTATFTSVGGTRMIESSATFSSTTTITATLNAATTSITTTTTRPRHSPQQPKQQHYLQQHSLRRPRDSAIQEVTTTVWKTGLPSSLNNKVPHQYDVTYAYHDNETEEDEEVFSNIHDEEDDNHDRLCVVECVETAATRKSNTSSGNSTIKPHYLGSSSSNVYMPRSSASPSAAATPMRKRLRSSTSTSTATAAGAGKQQQRHLGSDDNNNSNEKSSSRIGGDYQVAFLPPSNTYNKLKQASLSSSSTSSSLTMMPKGDVLWDPVLARKATGDDDGGINSDDVLEAFINQGKDLDSRMLLMESLHKTGYNMCSRSNSINNNISSSSNSINNKNSPAMREFLQLSKSGNNTNVNNMMVPVSMEERKKFAALFQQEKKQGLRYETVDRVRWFVHIAQSTGYPLQQVLVQYYGWKADFKTHDVVGYKAMKRLVAKKQSRQQASYDYCCICDDGGTLMVCDGPCNKCYHPLCLDPPMETIPEGEWFCPSCCSNAKKQPLADADATKSTTTTSLEKKNGETKDGDEAITSSSSSSGSGSSSGSRSKRTMTNDIELPVCCGDHIKPSATFALDDDALSKDQQRLIQCTGESSAQSGSYADKKLAKKSLLSIVQNNAMTVNNLETLSSKHVASSGSFSSFMDDDVQPLLKRKMEQAHIKDTGFGTKLTRMEVPNDTHVTVESPPAPPIIHRKLPHWPHQQQHPTPPLRHMPPSETQSYDAHDHYHQQHQHHQSAARPYSEWMLLRPCLSEPLPARVSTGTFPGVYQFFGSANTTATQQVHHHHYNQQQYEYNQPPPAPPMKIATPVSQRGMCRQPFVLRRDAYFPTNNDVTVRAPQQYAHHQQQQQQQQPQQQHQTSSSGLLSSVSRRGMSHRQPFVPLPRDPGVMNSYNRDANAAAILPSQFAVENP